MAARPSLSRLSLSRAIGAVLLVTDPQAKVMATRALRRAWRSQRIAHLCDTAMPVRPARPARPVLLPPSQMPNRRRAGSPASRIAMLHAFAHIEYVAIDLALDAAGRFGGQLPRAFVDDWLDVAADEALHFALLARRLRAYGSGYGALPAHDGLWDAARETAHDVAARLAIVPMVLEARGLDVSPATIGRFAAAGDRASAAVLKRIYDDEVRHVGVGVKWFEHVADSHGLVPTELWNLLVGKHFRGSVKPPFNDSARARAGLTRDYYARVALATAIPQ